MTTAQERTLTEMVLAGFDITNTYSDGAIRIARELPNGDTLYTFIGKNGELSFQPRIWQVTLEYLSKKDERDITDSLLDVEGPEVIITDWGDPVCTN